MKPQTAIVVPVRSFSGGKTRLAHLSPEARGALLRKTAEAVVRAAGGLPVVVVSGASEVRAWGATLDVAVLDDPGSLDGAASAGLRWARRRGAGRVVVVHADLPLAGSLFPLTRDGTQAVVAVVPCHRDDGTPVLSVPVDSGFRFAYGPGSFRRHAAEARRLGLGFRVVRDRLLAHDIDIPSDLTALDWIWEPAAGARPA